MCLRRCLRRHRVIYHATAKDDVDDVESSANVEDFQPLDPEAAINATRPGATIEALHALALRVLCDAAAVASEIGRAHV